MVYSLIKQTFIYFLWVHGSFFKNQVYIANQIEILPAFYGYKNCSKLGIPFTTTSEVTS